MKKLLSLFLIFALTLTSLGTFAFADDPKESEDVVESGDTTESTATDEEIREDLVVSSEGLLPFEDIDVTSWYVEGLTFCYSNGIISGAGNTYTFNPKGELTRATFAVMLARAIGADLTAPMANTFSDCDYSETSWYASAVEWAALNGYMNGTGEDKFSPNVTMTREQLATVFMRFMQKAEYEVEVAEDILSDYVDTSAISDWAADGVKYAVSAGLISSTSTSNKVASPKMSVTREQAVKLFTSFMRDYFFGVCEHQLSPQTCTEASVCSECGMVDKMPSGHLCEGLTCKDASVCTVCSSEVAADEGLHSYIPATCTTAESCTVCGTVRTGAYGHKFTPATCIKPATCQRCGEINGGIVAHNVEYGKCTVCTYSAFRTLAQKLVELDGVAYEYTSGSEGFEYYVIYDEERDEICIILYHKYSHGDNDVIMFSINDKNKTCQFDYEYYLYTEDLFFDGMGKFDPASFSGSAVISFSEYEGNESDVPTALSNVKVLGDTMLKTTKTVFAETFPEYDISMFGFVNYK